VALCVREYADMIETTLQSIINRGIVDIHIDSLWLVGANRSGCRRQIPHSCIGGSADWHQRRREETYGREPRSSSRVRGNIWTMFSSALRDWTFERSIKWLVQSSGFGRRHTSSIGRCLVSNRQVLKGCKMESRFRAEEFPTLVGSNLSHFATL
jgi:hypothetical protein